MLNGCQVCYVLQKGKLNACPNCKKLLCKACLPVSNPDFKCSECIRSELHEEVLSENIEKITSLKSEYEALMESAKITQLSLENLNEKCYGLENSLLVSEIIHHEKVRNLDTRIDKARSELNYFSTIENLENLIQMTRSSQKKKTIQYQDLLYSLQNEQCDFETEREKEKMASKEITEMSDLCTVFVPYVDIRGYACKKCLKTIQGKFREVLINGHIGRRSLIKSILDDERDEVRDWIQWQYKTREHIKTSCKCEII
ncbi:hypothetical protein SteCoe_30098 [Stentor coeruleus]|uniref:Uncharacterized protein n=1 Tax=Stentor coeruleus TaxID=5963 RepID=A0A1R2B4D9_9CILI|nr:hypothetical protein SteCoe_30098 [Stentor coeruleus]